MRKEILDADDLLFKVSSRVPYSMITPLNEPKIRLGFLAGKIKNPILEYKAPSDKLLKFRRIVSGIHLEEKEFVDSFLIEKQADLIRKIDLINSIGCFDFSEKSRKIYGIPTTKLLENAYGILNEKYKVEKHERMSSDDCVRKLKAAFKIFDLPYKIKKRNLVNSCLIRSGRKELILKKNHRYTRKFIDKLIIHEIGTHAFRYENGSLQELKIFKNGFANYLTTEEGLAVFNEERFGVSSQLNFRNYAGRVLAIYTAQNESFYNTFRELRNYFDKATAFMLTLRAKRGLSDTEHAGGYTKDLVYLKGYYDIKKYAETNKLRDLYYGKISIRDVPFVKRLKLVQPKYIPEELMKRL